MKKLAAIILFLFGISLFQACNPCRCPEVTLPYYNYTSLESYIITDTIQVIDTTAPDIVFNGGEYEYIGKIAPSTCSHNLYACSCIEFGHLGDKYPLVFVKLITNSDFDAAHPAGSNMNDIITFGKMDYDYQNNIETYVISEGPSVINPVSLRDGEYGIAFNSKPSNLNVPLDFTIEVTKTLGDKLITTTDVVVWN